MNFRILIFSFFLLLPTMALAHADLESASIEDGATVTEPLTDVSLTFTEAAELGFSTFKVYPLPAEAIGDDTADHGDEGGHGALDAAAETLMAEVIGVRNDESARADAGVSPSEGQSETVTLQLKDDLEPGAYAVMWRVLSVDAHAIEGFLTFTYDPGE